MALHNILVAAEPAAVWDVLADPFSYSEWVFGTRRITAADPAWPARSSSFGYEAGFGPFRFSGRSTVREVEPPIHLEIEADARLIAARVVMPVKPWGEHALAVVEEHWIRGPSVLLDNPVIDLALNLRNRWMVRNLASVVLSRAG